MELFYVRNAEEGGAETYSRSDAKKTLMLHYVFVAALLLEDCQMAPPQVRPTNKLLQSIEKVGEQASTKLQRSDAALRLQGGAAACQAAAPHKIEDTFLDQAAACFAI